MGPVLVGIAYALDDLEFALVIERIHTRHFRVQAYGIRDLKGRAFRDDDIGTGDMQTGILIERQYHVEAIVAAVELDEDEHPVRFVIDAVEQQGLAEG